MLNYSSSCHIDSQFPNMKIFLIILLVCATNKAQFTLDGACPAKSQMANITMEKYAGVWYEFYQTPPIAAKCVTTTYTKTTNGKITIHETSIDKSGKGVSDGYLLIEPTQWVENFLTPEPRDLPYKVLNTDYTSYTILYDCQPDSVSPNDTSLVSVYVLTRDQQPSRQLDFKIRGLLRDYGICPSKVDYLDQTGCY